MGGEKFSRNAQSFTEPCVSLLPSTGRPQPQRNERLPDLVERFWFTHRYN
jgi:hypothetical protein